MLLLSYSIQLFNYRAQFPIMFYLQNVLFSEFISYLLESEYGSVYVY